ncbi:predicted protein [Lichtheimia corymbifera JMRC:FSU:9682]|uniref:Uncharacterized protein n=1 Tax=Lichtheimia corymbifera JMRC:FSU:9682 TaxID=1263082 RepID=A0A068S7A0_9FUNG|nr:predicted protein [Lichtheimia corymbifera JMRC:FSU:9682]
MSTTHSCLYINKDSFFDARSSYGKEPSLDELYQYDLMAFNSTTTSYYDDRRERRGESFGYCTLRSPPPPPSLSKKQAEPPIPTCISLFLNENHQPKLDKVDEPKRSSKVTTWWSRTVSCKWKKPFGGKSKKQQQQQQQPLRLAEHTPVWFTHFSSNPSLTRNMR